MADRPESGSQKPEWQDSEPTKTPMAVAMEWVAKIFAAALVMCLPGFAGQWLDRQWDTSFVGLAGFALGLVGGMSYLVAAAKAAEAERKTRRRTTRDK